MPDTVVVRSDAEFERQFNSGIKMTYEHFKDKYKDKPDILAKGKPYEEKDAKSGTRFVT